MHRTDYLFMVSAKSMRAPTKSKYTTRIFFSCPCFFFFWQVKRLSDFYVSLDFRHEVVMTYQGPSPWKSLFSSHLSLVKFSLNHVPPYGGLVELMCYGTSRRAAKRGCERLYVAVQQLKRVEHCSSIFS